MKRFKSLCNTLQIRITRFAFQTSQTFFQSSLFGYFSAKTTTFIIAMIEATVTYFQISSNPIFYPWA